MTIRDEIIRGMARAYFVIAYADFIEGDEIDEKEREGLPRPGAQEDWMDYAPATSPDALKVAHRLVKAIEENTARDLDTLYRETALNCSSLHFNAHIFRCTDRTHTPDSFGHYLAMEAMGSGVAWGDDHAELSWDVPYVNGTDWFMILTRREALAGEK